MRLTEKNNTGYLTSQKYFPSKEFENKNELESAALLLNKLGQLEDKEELCIKMTTQPIYEKFFNSYVRKLNFSGYNASYDFKNNCIMLYNGHTATIYSVKDYGKTWAFTKEELS